MVNELIKFTFDIFAHVIPGIIILAAFSLLTVSFKPQPVVKEKTEVVNNSVVTKQAAKEAKEEEINYGLITKLLNNLEGTGQGVVAIILAYLVGFIINPIGRNLYLKINNVWPREFHENEVDMFVSDKFVLIRELSPINFQYVERWNMYCSLSHNLAVGCLVFFVVSFIQLFVDKGHIMNWIIIMALSLILFFMLIRSAAMYGKWAKRDLNAAISALNLKQKAQS